MGLDGIEFVDAASGPFDGGCSLVTAGGADDKVKGFQQQCKHRNVEDALPRRLCGDAQHDEYADSRNVDFGLRQQSVHGSSAGYTTVAPPHLTFLSCHQGSLTETHHVTQSSTSIGGLLKCFVP